MSRLPPQDPPGGDERLMLDREMLRLPLLTDEIGATGRAAAGTASSLPPPFFQPELLVPSTQESRAVGDAAVPSEATLVERVLADVQRQLDAHFELRLREALVPVLTRLGEQLLEDSRAEIAASLREIVSRAVQQELQRQRRR